MDQTTNPPDGDGLATAHPDRPVLQSVMELADDLIVPTALPKAAVVELSHLLEDLVAEHESTGALVAAFQEDHHLDAERARYERLAAHDHRTVVVFSPGEVGTSTRVRRFPVDRDHPLTRDWLVIALADRLSAVLVGRELIEPDEATDHRARSFLTVCSVDPAAIAVVCGRVAALAGSVSDEAGRTVTDIVASYPPVRAPSDLAQRVTHTFHRLAGRTARAHERTATPAADRRALVVDDDAAIRGLVEALLRRAGWEVDTAADTDAALRSVGQIVHDVVLLAVRLGDQDGVAVLRELDAHRPGLRERTVFLADVLPPRQVVDGCPVLGSPVEWEELDRLLASLSRHPRHTDGPIHPRL